MTVSSFQRIGADGSDRLFRSGLFGGLFGSGFRRFFLIGCVLRRSGFGFAESREEDERVNGVNDHQKNVDVAQDGRVPGAVEQKIEKQRQREDRREEICEAERDLRTAELIERKDHQQSQGSDHTQDLDRPRRRTHRASQIDGREQEINEHEENEQRRRNDPEDLFDRRREFIAHQDERHADRQIINRENDRDDAESKPRAAIRQEVQVIEKQERAENDEDVGLQKIGNFFHGKLPL